MPREGGIHPISSYRKKWNLPDDDPMIAKNYTTQRSAIAREQGLGKRAV